MASQKLLNNTVSLEATHMRQPWKCKEVHLNPLVTTSTYWTSCTYCQQFTSLLTLAKHLTLEYLRWGRKGLRFFFFPLVKWASFFPCLAKSGTQIIRMLSAANLNISDSTLRSKPFSALKNLREFQTTVIEKSPNTHSQRRYTLLQEQSTNCKVFNLHSQYLRAVVKNL